MEQSLKIEVISRNNKIWTKYEIPQSLKIVTVSIMEYNPK